MLERQAEGNSRSSSREGDDNSLLGNKAQLDT